MQKFTKVLVQITDLLQPPPLYNGLWGGGVVVPRNILEPPPPHNPLYKGGGGGSKKSLRNNPFCKLMSTK